MSKEAQAFFQTIGALGFVMAVLLIVQPIWGAKKVAYQCPSCHRVWVQRWTESWGPPAHVKCNYGCELGTAERFDPPIEKGER